MRLSGLVVLMVAAAAAAVALSATATAGAAVPVKTVRVPGETQWLAVDGGAAFVLRRTSEPYVVRVDLATGRRTVVFRTTGFPSDEAYAAGGVLGFGVVMPGDPERTQAIAVPTAPGSVAMPVRGAVEGPAPAPCSDVVVDGVTPAGELVTSTFSAPCDRPSAGSETVAVVGAGGDRTVQVRPMDVGAPLGNLTSPTFAAERWAVLTDGAQSVRLVDTTTGATRRFTATLPSSRLLASDLQADGRFVLTEIQFRARGGYVQRVRIVGPGDAARGGRVLGTLGTPPRLNAVFCGGRLVVLKTKTRRTRVIVGGREIARLSTPADPRFGCDARRLVVQEGGAATRLGVVPLPAAAAG
jgi:hypothetical protein